MGVLDKCCGNCAHSYAKDIADYFCICGVDDHLTSCDEVCDNHNLSVNGWVELTPDNVDEVDSIGQNRVVIATMIEGVVFSSVRADSDITLKSCSELGGYYYYVLPELKIE